VRPLCGAKPFENKELASVVIPTSDPVSKKARELVPREANREMAALSAQGRALRAWTAIRLGVPRG
jgi:hypothetical protein